jgi:hypothetical protein
MKKHIMIIIGIVLSCHYIGIAAQKEDGAQMFKHKKYLTIIGQDWETDQTDYPVKIHALKGDGEDQGMSVHLGDSDVRNDFGDVRFYDETGPLPYWQEKTEKGKLAIFWVKIRKIPRNGKVNIRLEYGNPNVETASDGKSTFHFFDDFLTDCMGKAPAYKKRGKNADYPPGWWMTGMGNGTWIVTNSIIRFRGGSGSHLTTEDKVWMSPSRECYTLRFRAAWPDPVWVNKGENGLSVGAISWDATDRSAFVVGFGLFSERPGRSFGGKTSVCFGNLADIPKLRQVYPDLFNQTNKLSHSQVKAAIKGIERADIKAYAKAYKGDFFTFEIERKPRESIGRVIEPDEMQRSDYVIDDPMSLMIHGCHYDYPDSPYVSIDWMLLHKQAYPNPVYGGWSDNLKK